MGLGRWKSSRHSRGPACPTHQPAVPIYLRQYGEDDERLIRASSPTAESVDIHEMKIEDNVSHAKAETGIKVPAGNSVLLQPSGTPLMLTDWSKVSSSR